MSYALHAGVTGLVCHQRMLDVVANNLANLNTTGYKYGQTRFADLLYVPILRSTGGVGTQGGGNNPAELGAGVKIAEITRKFSQGNLEGTGEMFDFAIQGDGLFVLNDGTKNVYTRDGSFGLDGLGYLVDPATGNRVQRFGTLGDDSASDVGFQVRGNSDIRVPFGATIPGQVTSAINILGNLDASSPGPARAEFQSVNPLVSGGVAATAATRLNDLSTNSVDYIAGDTIEITGGDVDGTAISGSLTVDATTTVGDLLAAINAAFNQATATLDASGRIVLRADDEGAALLNLSLTDASGNTGQSDWDRHRMALVTQGRDGAQSETIVEIFDILGTARALKLTFQKQDPATGVLRPPSMPPTAPLWAVGSQKFNSAKTGVSDRSRARAEAQRKSNSSTSTKEHLRGWSSPSMV